MINPRAEEAAQRLARYQELWTQSGPWRNLMALITQLVRPVRAEIRGTLTDGAKRLNNIYDATGIIANNELGSAIYGSAANPADQWFRYTSGDPDLDKWPKAQSAITTINRRLLRSYGPSYSAFYGQTFPLYLDAAGLGTAFFFQEPRADHSGFIDKCVPLSECEFALDSEGRLSEFYWKWCPSYAEAARELGKENLSDAAVKKLESKPNDAIEILRCYVRNPDYAEGMLGPKGKKILSQYIEMAEKHFCREGGYEEMPFYAPAWERASGERHGRGAGEIALADLQSAQVMRRANLMAGEWQANPPWGTARDIDASNLRPGDIVANAVSAKGELLTQALHKNAGTPFSLEMTQDLRQAVKDAFSAAMITVVGPNRTGLNPEETLDLREEKFRRMAPYIGNLTDGFLAPHVTRRFRFLRSIGVFKDVQMPAELKNRMPQFEFISPMALAQKAAKASGAIRAGNALAAIAPMKPEVMDRFNGDAFAKVVTDAWSPDLQNDDDVTAQNRKARETAMAQAHMAEVADKAAGAAQKGAGAITQLRQSPRAA